MLLKDREWTEAELEQVIELVGELVNANEELNARIIAMNAKLLNEEAKVKKLQQHLAQISLMFTNNTYEA